MNRPHDNNNNNNKNHPNDNDHARTERDRHHRRRRHPVDDDEDQEDHQPQPVGIPLPPKPPQRTKESRDDAVARKKTSDDDAAEKAKTTISGTSTKDHQATADSRTTGSSEHGYGINDVLCGRGRIAMTHDGNKRFRDTIEQYMEEYIYGTNQSRSMIIQNVIDTIRSNGGEFKKKTGYPPRYIVLSMSQCREKVGHALRDSAKAVCRKRGIALPNPQPTSSTSTTLDDPITNSSHHHHSDHGLGSSHHRHEESLSTIRCSNITTSSYHHHHPEDHGRYRDYDDDDDDDGSFVDDSDAPYTTNSSNRHLELQNSMRSIHQHHPTTVAVAPQHASVSLFDMAILQQQQQLQQRQQQQQLLLESSSSSHHWRSSSSSLYLSHRDLIYDNSNHNQNRNNNEYSSAVPMTTTSLFAHQHAMVGNQDNSRQGGYHRSSQQQQQHNHRHHHPLDNSISLIPECDHDFSGHHVSPTAVINAAADIHHRVLSYQNHPSIAPITNNDHDNSTSTAMNRNHYETIHHINNRCGYEDTASRDHRPINNNNNSIHQVLVFEPETTFDAVEAATATITTKFDHVATTTTTSPNAFASSLRHTPSTTKTKFDDDDDDDDHDSRSTEEFLSEITSALAPVTGIGGGNSNNYRNNMYDTLMASMGSLQLSCQDLNFNRSMAQLSCSDFNHHHHTNAAGPIEMMMNESMMSLCLSIDSMERPATTNGTPHGGGGSPIQEIMG